MHFTMLQNPIYMAIWDMGLNSGTIIIIIIIIIITVFKVSLGREKRSPQLLAGAAAGYLATQGLRAARQGYNLGSQFGSNYRPHTPFYPTHGGGGQISQFGQPSKFSQSRPVYPPARQCPWGPCFQG